MNQHRNGLMNPEGFYYQHRPEPFTAEDYLAGRWLQKPLNIWDADLPIQTSVAYLYTTPERAKDMKQPPVLHSQPRHPEGRGAELRRDP